MWGCMYINKLWGFGWLLEGAERMKPVHSRKKIEKGAPGEVEHVRSIYECGIAGKGVILVIVAREKV